MVFGGGNQPLGQSIGIGKAASVEVDGDVGCFQGLVQQRLAGGCAVGSDQQFDHITGAGCEIVRIALSFPQAGRSGFEVARTALGLGEFGKVKQRFWAVEVELGGGDELGEGRLLLDTLAFGLDVALSVAAAVVDVGADQAQDHNGVEVGVVVVPFQGHVALVGGDFNGLQLPVRSQFVGGHRGVVDGAVGDRGIAGFGRLCRGGCARQSVEAETHEWGSVHGGAPGVDAVAEHP